MPKIIDTDRLFTETVQLFAERGYSATTTREIAQRAGINEATIFRRYDTKANLIVAALTHCLANSPFSRLQASQDVRADLLAIVTAYKQTFEEFGGAVTTMMIEMPRHEELRAAGAALLPNMQKCAEIMLSHQSKGRLSSDNPVQQLAVLISPIMVSGMLAKASPHFNVEGFSPQNLVDGFLAGHQ